MGEEKKITGSKNVILCVISILILCVLMFPLFWTLITSLKTEKEIFQNPPTFYPHVLNTQSYAAQVETGDFNMFRSFANSFLVIWQVEEFEVANAANCLVCMKLVKQGTMD